MKNRRNKLWTLSFVIFLYASNCFAQASIGSAKKLISSPVDVKIEDSEISAKNLAPFSVDMPNLVSLGAKVDNTVKEVKLNNSPKARGPKEVAIFEQISFGTVLIVAGDGLGSGALITENGYIITNQHVVGKNKQVAVFFKPVGNSVQLDKNSAIKGEVVKVNESKDLALVKVDFVPASARPIAITNGSPKVGEDAHAIGHPKGQFWTYTRGYVSAIRDGYKWSGGKGKQGHEAKVVQTQTPINPGNSGGPLVDDERRLIGINSFIAPDSPGINFAVSADDVKEFIAQQGSTTIPKQSRKNCGDNIFAKGKDSDKNGAFEYVAYDTNCMGKVDALLRIPLDKSESIIFLFDSNDDGKWDVFVFDNNRDGKWDVSYHDTNFDGKLDLMGKHPDGKLVPSSFEKVN
jgi:S1-C subfamily serine protease